MLILMFYQILLKAFRHLKNSLDTLKDKLKPNGLFFLQETFNH